MFNSLLRPVFHKTLETNFSLQKLRVSLWKLGSQCKGTEGNGIALIFTLCARSGHQLPIQSPKLGDNKGFESCQVLKIIEKKRLAFN